MDEMAEAITADPGSAPPRRERRVPSTTRGRALRQRLLDAGRGAFLARGYHEASVSGICQAAGVSNGAFYQYFLDKEELFLVLWNDLQAMLLSDLRAAVATGDTYGLKGRVEMAAAALTDLLHRERALFQVFREAEFVATDTAKSFYGTLEAELPRLLAVAPTAQPVAPAALTHFVLGVVSFNVVARSIWEIDHHPLPTITDFLLRGMAPAGADPGIWLDVAASPTPTPTPPPAPDAAQPLKKGERTRLRILDAAESLFGTLGYHECGTAKIAELAGVGQGTLYRHFKNKEAMLEELVRRTNRSLRSSVERSTRSARSADDSPVSQHRLRLEVRALRAFLDFIPAHHEMYRVVREAEFVRRDLGRWYYTDLADDYRSALEQAIARGEVRPMNPQALALAIMGIGHHLGLRWPVWEAAAVPAEILQDTIGLMMTGILGRP